MDAPPPPQDVRGTTKTPPLLPPGIWVLIAIVVVVIGLGLFGYLTGAWDLPIDD